jgi:hypothetical protein
MTRAKAMEQWVYMKAEDPVRLCRLLWIWNGFIVATNTRRRRAARLKHSLTQLTINNLNGW